MKRTRTWVYRPGKNKDLGARTNVHNNKDLKNDPKGSLKTKDPIN